jgi:hypothetical protein
LPKIVKGRAINFEFGPTAKIAVFHSWLFECDRVESVAGESTHFSAKGEPGPIDVFRLPLNRQAQGGLFGGGFAKDKLVSVALVKAWRESMTALAVKQLRQDFDYLSFARPRTGSA